MLLQMGRLAVLVTNVNQKENQNLVGQIFEVYNHVIVNDEGKAGFSTVDGTYKFNPETNDINFDPDFLLGIKNVEILEEFDIPNNYDEELKKHWARALKSLTHEEE